MKKYLIKIFEKLQENQGSINSMNESPDPLNEHANSVHDHLMKRDNQSSLSEINNLDSSNMASNTDNTKVQTKERQGGNLSNGGSGRH